MPTEPLEWTDIESDPEFQAIPFPEKEAVFNNWKSDVAGFLKNQGAPNEAIQAFDQEAQTNFNQRILLPEVEQAKQTAIGIAEMDVAPYRVNPADEQILNNEAVTAMRLYKERGEWESLPRAQREAVERRAAKGQPEKPFVETQVAPENPMTRFFGPAVTAQAQKEMSRGMTDNAGAVVGGALGTQMLMGLRGGPLGVLLPVAGAISGAVAGGGVQEEATALLENSPEVTAARRERTAQLQNSPEYKAGSIAAMGALFRPSASVIRGALRGDAAAVQNIAMGGGLGVGTAAMQPILEGRMPSMNELLEGGALGLALHQPTRLAQGLFGFHPIQLKPNPGTETVRTPIGTLDAEGRIVHPDTPEGTALRATSGLDATTPTNERLPLPSKDAESLLDSIAVNHTDDGVTNWEAVRGVLENLQPKSGADPELVVVLDEALQLARQRAGGEEPPPPNDVLPPEGAIPEEPLPPTGETPPPPADVSGERVQPPWPNPDPVGIRNEFTEAERVRLGFPNRDEPIARSFPELHAEAERAFAQNPEVGRNLVEELKATPRAHTGPEAAVLTFETARQQKLVDRAYEAVNNARTPEELAKAQADLSTQAARYQDALSVSELSGTQASEALYARRLIVNEDFSLARMLARERATKPDAAPLTQPEIAEVSRIHDNIKTAQENVAKVENKVADVEAEQIHKQLLKEVGRGAKSAAKEKKGVVDYFNEQAEAARKRIIARRGRLQTGDPLNLAGLVDEAIIGASHIAKGVRDFAQWSKQMLTEFGERVRPHLQDLFTRSSQIEVENSKPFRTPTPAEILNESDGTVSPKLVGDLWLAHVREGITEHTAVRKAVTADLQGKNPNVTERQVQEAFTNYGKRTYPSKEADKRTLQEHKNLERITLQIQDLERNVIPKKTGFQREKATAQVRELTKHRNRLMRELGINPTDPATQLASAHTARVTRLKNTIEELQSNIAAGKRTPQTEGVPWTAEELALRDQVNVLRDQLDAVLGTPESDKLNGLLKRIEAVTEKLRTGNIEPKTGKPTVDTLQVAQAKEALKVLNKELMRARREAKLRANPPATPDEKRLAALERTRDDLALKVAEGDTSSKTGKPTAATAEQARVMQEIEGLQKVMAEMRKAERPARPEDQTQFNALQKQIESLQSQIAKGEADIRAKRPTADTARVATAKEQVAALREQLRKILPESEDAKVRELERRLATAQAKVASGDFGPASRKATVDTARVAEVRAQLETVNKQIAEARAAVRNSPEAQLARAKEASLARQKEIQRRINANDYAPPVKKDKVMDRELLQHQFDEARLKDEWNNRAADKEWDRTSAWGKTKAIIGDLPNVARILITSADGPPILRQTLNAPTTPIRTAKAAWASMKALFSEKARFDAQKKLEQRKNAPLYEASGLRISRPNSSVSKTEEQFLNRIVARLPWWTGVGPLARAAERSFSTYMNKYRADAFDAMYKFYKPGDFELADMASRINDFTGSATLSQAAERAVPFMNKWVFAFRKAVADIRVASLAPVWGKGSLKARAYAVENYIRLLAGASVYLGLAKVFGLHYETDPRSKNFAQVYVPGENGQKGVWHDTLSGPAKAFVLGTRIFTGETRNNKGQLEPLRKTLRPLKGTDIGARGKPAFKENVRNVFEDYFIGKGSPLLSNILQEMDQEDPTGEPLTAQSRVIKNAVPISYQQIVPIFERLGIPKGIGNAAWNFFGGGSQPAKYQPRSAIKMEPLIK